MKRSEIKQVFADYLELTKPRICVLALMMASLGFALGSLGEFDKFRWAMMIVGLTLVGAGCGALNQFLERDTDALMWRTRNRPLPAGRLRPGSVVVFGFITTIIGEIVLVRWVNPVTAILGAVTLISYVAVYTPSKRWTSLSTLLGAIPGALPPLMGWTAAYGSIAPGGLLLFAILFLWQVPHFLAIAWVYREDYARANFPILSVIDSDGLRTVRQVILYSVVLLPLTLLPTLWGITGTYYFFGAMLLGFLFLGYAFNLALYRSKVYARKLFFVSILYLPALGFLMVWDRVF